MRLWISTLLVALLAFVPAASAQAPLEIDVLEGYLGEHDAVPMLPHCARHDGTFFTPNGPATVPGGGTNAILREHKDWHLEYEGQPGSQGTTDDTDRFGDHFVYWHRDFIGAYEAWRLANGYTALPAWDPSTPIPQNLSYEFPGRGCSPGRNTDPAVALPTWATREGGAEPDPLFGHVALCEFKDINQFGKALAREYHPAVHRALGGDMSGGQGPRDPVFWSYHRFLDNISLEFEHHCSLMEPAAPSEIESARGIPATGLLSIVASLALARSLGRRHQL